MSETPIPEMVERVAEALWQSESIRCTGERRRIPYSEVGNERLKWQMMAEAAIEAMSRPNLAMRKVCSFPTAAILWPAMIDAALSSPASTEED